ncbi:MAG: hypothetical protein HOJ09_05485, partial [Gammaproteobacteria bacterium]|nr:hypothetical protein [Gammaproteobacteria bacterium]
MMKVNQKEDIKRRHSRRNLAQRRVPIQVQDLNKVVEMAMPHKRSSISQ